MEKYDSLDLLNVEGDTETEDVNVGLTIDYNWKSFLEIAVLWVMC